MKKILLILFLFSVNYIYSQSGWFWQNPQPTGDSLGTVQFLDANTGFIAVADGSIMKTINGGANWTFYNTGYTNLSSFYFFDAQTGIVRSGSGTFIKTVNGGANWSYLSTFNSELFYNLIFINNQTGFALGSSTIAKIIKTTNGGANWSYQLTDSTFRILSMSFPSSVTGYAAGFNFYNPNISKLLKTTNSGNTWDTISSEIHSQLESISFVNDYTGYICSYTNIYKTTNGGENWISIYFDNGSIAMNLHFINESTGYRDMYYSTTNGGYNWQFIYPSFGQVFSYCFTGNIVYSVGPGVIAKTNNSGYNWSELTSGFHFNLNGVKFYNAQTGFACGDNGKVIKTTNGGLQWSEINFPNSYNYLCTISMFDNNHWYVGDYFSGKIFRTTDNGITWDTINTNHGSMTRIQFLNSNTGFAAYKYHTIAKTTDGGLNWNYSTFPSYEDFGLYFVNASTGFFGGEKLYKTTNSGNTWDTLITGQYMLINQIQFLNSNTGFISGVGAGATVMRTTNGGLNWNSYNFQGAPYSVFDINFLNERYGFASLQTGIFRTTDGGVSFLKVSNVDFIQSICVTDSLTAYGVGQYGGIIKTTNGGGQIIGVTPVSNIVPDKFSLSQNYPNSFNPTTKIKFEIPSVGSGRDRSVKLIIYDILGREVTTLVNEQLQPGTYSVEWNAANFASGIYFYSLSSGDFYQTKKMVLIK